MGTHAEAGLSVETVGLVGESTTLGVQHCSHTLTCMKVRYTIFLCMPCHLCASMDNRPYHSAHHVLSKVSLCTFPCAQALTPSHTCLGNRQQSTTLHLSIFSSTHALSVTQTSKEFETVCPGLSVVSVYGGTSISMQISDLRRGADVVVGTPGRIIDLIERGSLSLDAVSVMP